MPLRVWIIKADASALTAFSMGFNHLIKCRASLAGTGIARGLYDREWRKVGYRNPCRLPGQSGCRVDGLVTTAVAPGSAQAQVPPPGAREHLLETASAIMRDGDIVDISLSELSLRAGLNSALVKYYFGNKAGLLKALMDRDWKAIIIGVDALVAKDDMDAESKLRRHISKVIDTFYAVPYLNRLTMRMVRESDDEEARRIADCYLSPIYRAYEALIGQGVRAGVFRPVDPQLFYFTVTGAVDRFFSARLVMKYCFDQDTLTEELRDRYREHTIDIIMAGILSR